MSREHVEVVRQCYQLFERRDIEGVLGLVTDDFELRLPDIYPEGPETYRGPDGLRRWLAMVQDTWGEWRIELERLIDVDEQVVALVRIVAEGGASGVPVDREVAHVWSFRDGKMSTASVHLDRTEALKPLGLSEQATSGENVEVVRRCYEAYNRGDLEGFLACTHPRVVWEENHPVFGFVGLEPVYEGHEGVRLWWEATREPWTTVEAEIHETIPAGDDALVVSTTMHGTGAGSGVVVELRFFHVVDFRGGRIARRRLYPEREEALGAVGLRE